MAGEGKNSGDVILSGHDTRRLRLYLLNVYATGYVAWAAVGFAIGSAAGDVAWDAARYAAWDAAGYAAGYAAGDATGDATRAATRAVATKVAKSERTPRQIAYASCRQVILDRKKIYAAIDALGDKVPSTAMTTEEVAKHCQP